MLVEQKQQLAELIRAALGDILEGRRAAGMPDPAAPFDVDPLDALERPKQADHGDVACILALQIAKPLKMSPRAIAEKIAAWLRNHDGGRLIESLDVAGPGFINIRLTATARRAVIGAVLTKGAQFGRNRRGEGRPVMIEFVSANPTGPLHVGHGRQAALGDALAALYEANDWRVTREFYYNDAGAQIDNLARSVQARGAGIGLDDPRFPADGYRGEYINDIADEFLAGKTMAAQKVAAVTANRDLNDLDSIRRFAVACLRHEQDMDLIAFGVRFDNYFLESSLYSDHRVEAAVNGLIAAGHTFEEGGALWLRTTDYGDDKDRVMRKSDGTFTYFVPDVAYHVDKWQRGFARAINVQGSDHHGTIARVRAGLQALGVGIPKSYPEYVLHKMVTVMRGGEEVKISKRAGSYVTLRDLIEWSGGVGMPSGDAGAPPDPAAAIERGRDAVRFFLISRKADSEFQFDVDLALSRTDENPVYYVQYAHARICSVLAQAVARYPRAASGTDGPADDSGGRADSKSAGDRADDELMPQLRNADLSALVGPREFALMAQLAGFPDLVATACDEMAPHSIAFYLKDLASELHSYYNAERFLVDEPSTRLARLALLAATRQVLRNGLALLGVSAPERM